MRSSTSAFSSPSFGQALVLLLCGLVLYLGALEIATRTVFPRMSQGKHRELEDYAAALQVRPTATQGRPSVLVIGNSLLLEGVQRGQLREAMAPAAEVSLFPIEGTTYLDWYYGMQRFFAEGARPSVVALCINARQVLSNGTNGERFAHSMMRLSDLRAVKQASHLDSMTTSAYFFANLSAWLSDRSYVRNGMLEKFMPSVKSLVGYFSVRDPNALTPTQDVVDRSLTRLRAFDDLARQYGARFIWLVPPTLNADDPAPAIRQAGMAQGLSIVIPYPPAALPPSAFADGFHLNAQGAASFTAQAIPALREQLAIPATVQSAP